LTLSRWILIIAASFDRSKPVPPVGLRKKTLVQGSRIVGTGSFLPDRCISNSDISAGLHLEPSGVHRRTGIQTRYWARDGQASSDLAEQAARRALEAAGVSADSIDGILVSTTSPDMVFPSTACHLQRRLGLKGPAAFDLGASCSGFLYGLSMADVLIRAGRFRRCLVVGAEIKSRSLDVTDAATAVLFGDGAGAAVVTAEPDARPLVVGGHGILGIRLFADGSRQNLLQVAAGGSRQPTTPQTLQDGLHAIRMQGGALFRVAVKRLAGAVNDILKEFGLSMGDVGQAIFHQANGRLLASLAERLGLPEAKLFSVIEAYGNTSSASLPIALDCAVRAGRIRSGDVVLLGAFGGGLTWATGLMRW
jgi:3-oxoacyl-[acyl-carrier-protein] synthase-3